MDLMHARSCGLDVHKKSVVACVLITRPDRSVERHMRTFKTMTADLLARASKGDPKAKADLAAIERSRSQ